MGLHLKVYQQFPFPGNYILESFNFVVPRCNHRGNISLTMNKNYLDTLKSQRSTQLR